MTAPLVTVLLPVYNGEAYIEAAVNSVLEQSFSDFELLIVDDGSTDKTPEILRRFLDPRIRILRNNQNIRLIKSLNRGLDEAKGKYIARFDADDEMLPFRLRRQVDYLEKNSSVGVLGSAIQVMGSGSELRVNETDPQLLPCRILFLNPFFHPTVMLRKSVLDQHQLRYEEDYPHAEDYAFWVKLKNVTGFANDTQPLIRYRRHSAQVSVKFAAEQVDSLHRIHRFLLNELGIEPDEKMLELHLRLYSHHYRYETVFAEEAEQYFLFLLDANTKTGTYPQEIFRISMGSEWFRVCTGLASKGIAMQQAYYQSALSKLYMPPLVDRLKLQLKKYLRKKS